ncbi:MAG: LPS export ABC transporter permease LptG [Salinarimonadaceae bacterium]|nr:MAG: LPS export ABC transporter permease LptG [Salinarimonadaceae bacterium]
MLIGRTLGIYIGMRFLRAVAGMFFTVFGLVYVIDFVELMRRAGDLIGVTALDMALLAFLRTPAVAEQVLPFAMLFGAMVALLNLSRKLELVVARAAGISAWQFLLPGIIVAALLGIFSLAVYNPLSAYLKAEASEMETRVFASNPGATSGRDIWIRQRNPDGTAVIKAESVVEGSTAFSGLTVFVFDREGRFVERVEAAEGVLLSGYWELRNGRVVTIEDDPQRFATMQLASSLDPAQVLKSFTPPESVPFWELRDVAVQTERAGLDATPYYLRYESLLARPMLFVAMVLVAASVSLRFFRFGGVGPLVLGGVVAGFLLYVFTQLMEDLGASGLVGTTLAAWFPAVVGSSLGALALLYQEDG